MPEILETNVKIKADASSLKKEANESINVLEKLQEKYKEVSAELSNAFANHGKASYISALTEQRNEIMRIISDIKSGAVELNQIDLSRVLGDNISTSGVEQVKDKVDEVNDSLKDVKNTQDEINHNWDTTGLKNLLKGVKRIATSIMGFTTIFTLIRKSMSQYLSQNDALREKLNGIYYAIGSMLAPILEWMVNLFAKIVLYVNAFLKGLGFAGIQFKSVANSANKTKKAMEKVKTIIAGFDELNIFNKQATDEAEEAADELKDPFADVEVNQEWIQKLYELGQKLRPYLEKIWEILKKVFDWVVEHLNLVLGILIAIKAIGLISKLSGVLGALKPIWTLLQTIGTSVINFIKNIISSELFKMISGIGLVIGGAVLAVSQFIDMWKNGWNIIGEILKDLGIALAAVGAVLLGAPAAIAAVVAGIVAVLSSLVVVIHEHWDEISVWLKAKWEKIKDTAEAIWTLLSMTVQYIIEHLSDWLKTMWNSISSWLTSCWENIRVTASYLWSGICTIISNLTSALASFLSSLWSGVRTVATNAWVGIRETVTAVLSSIQTFAIGVWNAIKDGIVSINTAMANAISSIWNGIIGVIKGAINGVLGFINGLISGMVNGLNSVIGVLNRFKVTIPSWVPALGGRTFGFNIPTLSAPQIPLLAKGGVINSPTMAMMGEYAGANNNPEIAAPQSLIREMLQENNTELVSAFAQMTQQVISAINNVDMEVSIGDDVIAQSASRGNRQYYNMTGRELITV